MHREMRGVSLIGAWLTWVGKLLAPVDGRSCVSANIAEAYLKNLGSNV
jgi:hypothetical protein